MFVNVSVLSNNETVPVAFGRVIVLSAVGSVTVNVVSFASFVEPSNTIELSVIAKPETFGDVIVLLVNVSEPASVANDPSDNAELNCAVVPEIVI